MIKKEILLELQEKGELKDKIYIYKCGDTKGFATNLWFHLEGGEEDENGDYDEEYYDDTHVNGDVYSDKQLSDLILSDEDIDFEDLHPFHLKSLNGD